MNKRFYILIALVAVLSIAFYSCGGSSNSNPYEVDDDWKAYQNNIYREIANDPSYTDLLCMTQNGYVYYKPLTGNEFPPVVAPTSLGITPKITQNGYPYFNDSVRVRYLGWYHYQDTEGNDKIHYFDGTENDEVNNPPLYQFNNQADPKDKAPGRGFRISNNLTSGFASMLQNMKAGDKVQVCIPYNLAYGEYGETNSGTIKGHTTLFFNIYLVRIIPVNLGEFPGADTGEGNH
ncbi:FKBP-type peptidyl-prolyl cis-trans isomerase [Dysgonomonas sp. 25]|uniref:FKBP-type peptidyl-prolyl cis-trans isomerase n=1 Tax=Dysgonomonas sp. 25 TaxID=2302933 RepID=UPI0013D1CA03|nr:FKBP-type peptidyl-prolyl cis-trans isomerase [Dysgonomonas sp. 25]NDV68668.1 hypothetical protein [Dysgonomonas sp. 25]